MDVSDEIVDDPRLIADLAGRAFALRVATAVPWTPNVLSLRGLEELSRPYHFDLTVEAPWGVAPERAELLGLPATLSMRAHPAPRVIHGVVSAVRARGGGDNKSGSYRLRIVPRFALLAQSRDSRIFQDCTVVDVVSQVLTEARVRYEWRRLGTYPKRPCCVQYQESDFAFVARLLAEESIAYAFESRNGVEVMVLSDHSVHYRPVSGEVEIPFVRAHGLHTGEHISSFAAGSAVRPGAVRLRRYDHQRPNTAIVAEAAVAKPANMSSAEAQGARAPLASDVTRLRVYDHHADYDDDRPTAASANRVLDQARRDAETGRGAGNCPRLTPGSWFKLVDAASDAFDGEWLVTRVEHRGRPAIAGETPRGAEYENAFRCVPRGVHYAPKLPVRRREGGLETATVVGPSGEEIYTDELGRVKVQFHWDVAGGYNEESSAWLRVVQGWSGQHAGVQFIPRVGTEVVVGFVGGDTDRPVVVGSMYNATHPPPFKLPIEKTRSGIRTSSTPGGVGHNELSFEDAAGREEVRIHAQRDLNESILHCRSMDVGADLSVIVAGNSTESIGGERVEVVRGGRASTVMGDASRHVVGAERAVVDGDRVELIRGVAELAAERSSTRIATTDEREVKGDARATIAGDQAERVQGCVTLQVGQAEAQTSYAVHVEGLAELHGRRAASLSSEEEITLTCGRSCIRITPDQIELVGPLVLISAEGAGARFGKDDVRVRASREATMLADTVVLRGEAASLGLDTNARLGGDKIQLGKVDEAQDFSPDEQPAPTRIELVDQDGQALAYRRFKLHLADGSTRAGLLDRNGAAVIDLELPAEVVFDSVQDVQAR
ncbi:MAG: type VI secretion system tip protein TssI/VgrG [Polyangiaceae bacterium]